MKSENISEFLQSKIDDRDFPSAVYLVAEKGEIIFQDALGFAVVEPEKIEASIDTIYDLASLTKPLVTGLLCVKLIENGAFDLSEKVCYQLKNFFMDGKKFDISFQNLLTHTSGFHSWEPFYVTAVQNGMRVINHIARTPLENPTSSEVIYSDINFIVLKILLEQTFGRPLDETANKKIFEPLGLQNTFFNPQKELRKRIAASEKGNEFEKQTCIERGYFDAISIPPTRADGTQVFRTETIWGEVHDNNCYFMDGVSGHAGLFSTAEEIFKIAQQFLPNQTTLLKPESCELFLKNFTPGLNQARSIAFQLAETPDSTASEALSKNSFGHLGFTGTSLWIEPSSERIFVLLTNRTHDRELPFADLKVTRQNFHRLAAEILDGK